MIEPIISWVLLVLLQKEGFVGLEFGTEEECTESRPTIASKEEVLAISECQAVTIKPVERKK